MDMQEASLVLSFSSYSCIRCSEIADRVIHEVNHDREEFELEFLHEQICTSIYNEGGEKQKEGAERKTNEDFEFAMASRNGHRKITVFADDMFSQGQIRTIFPVFEQDLFSSHKAPSASSRPKLGKLLSQDSNSQFSRSSQVFEAFPGAFYVQPKNEMSLERCKKKNSWPIWGRLKNLSQRNSDNKAWPLFACLGTCSKKQEDKDVKKTMKASRVKRSSDERMVERRTKKQGTGEVVKTGYEIFYMMPRALKAVQQHRTFLPYNN